tara:strand:- start:176 stop:325 length:150 start_codon:yes stop_codon:yes gene_type:complete
VEVAVAVAQEAVEEVVKVKVVETLHRHQREQTLHQEVVEAEVARAQSRG